MQAVLPARRGPVAAPPPPATFALLQNYPNPFNPETAIRYDLPADGWVSLRVYNLLGVEVATLADGPAPRGTHTARFNGARFPSGVYFCRILAGDFREVRAMVLAK